LFEKIGTASTSSNSPDAGVIVTLDAGVIGTLDAGDNSPDAGDNSPDVSVIVTLDADIEFSTLDADIDNSTLDAGDNSPDAGETVGSARLAGVFRKPRTPATPLPRQTILGFILSDKFGVS